MHVTIPGWRPRAVAVCLQSLVLLTAALAVPATSAADTSAPWVTTSGAAFVDAGGAPVVLRGVDVYPGVSAPVAAVGANFARIFIPWSSVEPDAPVDGVHSWSTSVLSAVDASVSALQADGIAVEIDMHQCGWSPYFGAGGCSNGVPAWYYADGRFPATGAGEADAKAAFWTTEAPRSEAAYAAFAQMMAERYSAYPNVIGFGIFNEPQPGSLPTTTATTNAMIRWQADVAASIRHVDPSRILFFMCRSGGEGITTADLSPLAGLGPVALDVHDYFNGTPGYGYDASGDNWSPSWALTHNQTSTNYQGTEAAQEAVLDVAVAKAQTAGIPLLLGEWGVRKDDSGTAAYQTQMLDLLARYRISAARWDIGTSDLFALRNPDGSFNAAGLQLQQDFATPLPPQAAPTAVAPPQISGTAVAGGTLTATAGVWTQAPGQFTYVWQRCAAGTCTPAGAAGPTYAVTDQDAGYRLTVTVTAADPAGSSAAGSTPSALVPGAPAGLAPPVISGRPVVGATLKTSTGSWTGEPSSFAYQWLRCVSSCAPIAAATAQTYTTVSADDGATITVLVTAANTDGHGSQSAAATAVILAPPRNLTQPQITGTLRVGATLTASTGTWTDSPSAYSYRWKRCSSSGCTAINGATAATYVLVRADRGRRMQVVVTAANAAGATSATSAKTASVA
jgi:Cellulase (glycosyl hydrolase family 5)